jgi:hypothetical protein
VLVGVFAVSDLNREFKLLLRESKNGLVDPFSYMLAKSVLVIPIMVLFSISSLGISGYAIQNFLPESFGAALILFASCLFVFESIAECLSVWFENGSHGMLYYMITWFIAFIFAGVLLPPDDMVWPFKLLYYILPFHYYLRSIVYSILIDVAFEPCTNTTTSAICTNTTSGADVLDELGKILPIFTSDDTVVKDIGIMIAIAGAFKVAHIFSLVVKSRRESKIYAS